MHDTHEFICPWITIKVRSLLPQVHGPRGPSVSAYHKPSVPLLDKSATSTRLIRPSTTVEAYIEHTTMPSLASRSAASANVAKDDKNQGEKAPPTGELSSGKAGPERNTGVIEVPPGQGKT